MCAQRADDLHIYRHRFARSAPALARQDGESSNQRQAGIKNNLSASLSECNQVRSKTQASAKFCNFFELWKMGEKIKFGIGMQIIIFRKNLQKFCDMSQNYIQFHTNHIQFCVLDAV